MPLAVVLEHPDVDAVGGGGGGGIVVGGHCCVAVVLVVAAVGVVVVSGGCDMLVLSVFEAAFAFCFQS